MCDVSRKVGLRYSGVNRTAVGGSVDEVVGGVRMRLSYRIVVCDHATSLSLT